MKLNSEGKFKVIEDDQISICDSEKDHDKFADLLIKLGILSVDETKDFLVICVAKIPNCEFELISIGEHQVDLKFVRKMSKTHADVRNLGAANVDCSGSWFQNEVLCWEESALTVFASDERSLVPTYVAKMSADKNYVNLNIPYFKPKPVEKPVNLFQAVP